MADEKLTKDPFEMFRRIWGPLGLPLPGMAMPTLDPQEVEKRIADLRSIEGWLSMNLGMVRMSIQGLEMQKAALLAMRTSQSESKPKAQETPDAPGAGDAAAAGAMLWPWALMQQAMAAGVGAATAPAEAKQPPDEGAGDKPAAPRGGDGPASRDDGTRKAR